jgi:hypothetical protein
VLIEHSEDFPLTAMLLPVSQHQLDGGESQRGRPRKSPTIGHPFCRITTGQSLIFNGGQ